MARRKLEIVLIESQRAVRNVKTLQIQSMASVVVAMVIPVRERNARTVPVFFCVSELRAEFPIAVQRLVEKLAFARNFQLQFAVPWERPRHDRSHLKIVADHRQGGEELLSRGRIV